MNGGFLLINKTDNISSSHLDYLIKKTLDVKKLGHLGTLDPLAKGLIIVMISDATKMAKYFDDLNKTYITTIRFGATTRSLDNEGEIIQKEKVNLEGKEDTVDQILQSFVGTMPQTPPIFSAVKINGVRAYKKALTSDDVNLSPRMETVYSIKRLAPIIFSDDSSYLKIEVKVSKGFYIRSLARDLGIKLKVPSMADTIQRVDIGPFSINDAFSLEDVQKGNYVLLDPLKYLSLEVLVIPDNLIKIVQNGGKLSKDLFKNQSLTIIKNKEGKSLAIYRFDESKQVFRLDYLISR